ncbi:MAG: hypothetical protein ACP5E9_10385 [Candidatus Methanospirareceae archaeon]
MKKGIKLPWYDTTLNSVLDMDDIMDEVHTWGWNETHETSIALALLIWNEGEIAITGFGNFDLSSLPGNVADILEEIDTELDFCESIIKYHSAGMNAFIGFVVAVSSINPLTYFFVEVPGCINQYMLFKRLKFPITECKRNLRIQLKGLAEYVNELNPVQRAVKRLKTVGEFENHPTRYFGKICTKFKITELQMVKGLRLIGRVVLAGIRNPYYPR